MDESRAERLGKVAATIAMTCISLGATLWIAAAHAWWSWLGAVLGMMVGAFLIPILHAPKWLTIPLLELAATVMTAWLFWLCWDVLDPRVLATATVVWFTLADRIGRLN